MSSEKVVLTGDGSLPDQGRFTQFLDSLGYKCELSPDFSFSITDERFFGIKVLDYPSEKPRVKPERNFIVCIGAEELLSNNFEIDEPIWANSKQKLIFRSSAGRSNLTYAMQNLLCGYLAQETNGYLYDPQQGDLLGPAEAVRNELESIKKYGAPHDLREQEFHDWE